MLTERQQTLLNIIKRSTANGGEAPTFQQMADALGLKSKSGIHRLLQALEGRGAIRRLPHRARAMEIVEPAHEDACSASAGAALRASRGFLERYRDELLRDFCAENSNLDRSTMDEDEAAFVAEVEGIIDQIDAALPGAAV